MKSLPENVKAYKQTPVFDQDSIPAGLLNQHLTKAGVWGKIIVCSGELLYSIGEPGEAHYEQIALGPDRFGVVEPEVLHHVAAVGEVSFYVEFNR